jgi:hypothetical protein
LPRARRGKRSRGKRGSVRGVREEEERAKRKRKRSTSEREYEVDA